MKQKHDDRKTFGVASFLYDRLPALVVALIFMVLIDTIIMAILGNIQLIVLLCCLELAGSLIIIGWSYMREARFWRQVDALLENLEKCNQLASFLEEPRFLNGVLANQLAEHLAFVSNAETLQLSSDMSSLRDYTELWIHEIKTPLAASKLILAGMHGVEATKLKLELERTEALVEQALFAARSTSLTNDYLIRDVNLLNLVQQVCKNNMNYLVARDISLAFDIPEDMHVLADKTWISFILAQLIINSAKYGAKNITFSASVVMPHTPEGHVVFEVKDDGCGIPATDVPRVFNRGFTGEVGRRYGSATGMGLYLAATMCNHMGIGISIASEEEKGTRVILAFPEDRTRMESSETRYYISSGEETPKRESESASTIRVASESAKRAF